MKVSGFAGQAVDAYLRNSQAQTKKPPDGDRSSATRQAETRADSVEFSGKSREVSQATRHAQQATEVRNEQVQEIKAAIKRGDYEFDIDILARRIAEALGER